MKVWARISDGKMMGYQSDFPKGLDGCMLVEQGEKPRVAAITDESTAVIASDPDERAALEAQYEAKFGKAPHPAMKWDTLRERLGA